MKCFAIAKREIMCQDTLWNISLCSMWNEINPYAPQRISHCGAIFHAQSVFHKSRKGFFSGGCEESTVCIASLAYLWLVDPRLCLRYPTSPLWTKKLATGNFFCVQTLSSSILQKRKNEHPTKVECSFLVDVRRIELLSKNLFIPVSPSADISLHSLLQPSNVGLL